MPGNPKKEGRTNPHYQVGRRRFTKVPGYHGVLWRVFPAKKDMSVESANAFIWILAEAGLNGFAVTSHPSTMDGHVTLWLSAECADYLAGWDYIENLESTGME